MRARGVHETLECDLAAVIRATIDGASPVTPAPGMVPGANEEDDEMIKMR